LRPYTKFEKIKKIPKNIHYFQHRVKWSDQNPEIILSFGLPVRITPDIFRLGPEKGAIAKNSGVNG